MMITAISVNQAILTAIAIGFASGSIGAFIILRRMALVGDALSHVALPGIAIALFYKLDPFLGVLVFLIGAAFLVWWLEGKSRLPTDALVGLLFTTSLAIGILTIPDTEIIESLFGAFPVLSIPLFATTLVFATAATASAFILTRKFLFITVSPDVAHVSGIGRKYNFLLFLIFSVVVALGIKLVGTLLMGALTIIPASISKNVTRSMTRYIIAATFIGGSISMAGVIFSQHVHVMSGPAIILLGSALFIVSLFFAYPSRGTRSKG